MDFGLGRARPELLAKEEQRLAKKSLQLDQAANEEAEDDWENFEQTPEVHFAFLFW